MITAILAQFPALPAIHNVWEFVGFIAILLAQLYQSRQTQQLKGSVNGRLEELLHSTRARAHAEGHSAGIKYEQQRTLASIKPADPSPDKPITDTR
jgi:hypothetical protein